MNEVTKILNSIDNGDPRAAEQLLPLVYDELKRLAAARLSRENQAESLQPTLLVHEAYIRLVDVEDPQQWNGRAHFFGAAAEAMRRIIIEKARRRMTKKRRRNLSERDPDHFAETNSPDPAELLAVDEALSEFHERWPEKAQLVKLRYFVGLSTREPCRAMHPDLHSLSFPMLNFWKSRLLKREMCQLLNATKTASSTRWDVPLPSLK